MKRLFSEHITRKVTDLSGSWRFLTDPKDEGEKNGWAGGLPSGETVIVPSQWNNELGLLNYDGSAWYEKRFYTDGGTLRFEFESVMTKADVWLDGKYLGNHYGAFSQFEFIVRDVAAGEHTLTVRADSRFDKKSIPQKHTDWFNYGGIARDVSVESLSGICILENHIQYTLSADFADAEVCTALQLYNADGKERSSTLTVRLGETEIYRGQVTLSAGETKTLLTPSVTMRNISLWEMESPALYTVVAATDTDDLIDRVGFRFIESKNNQILLNGKPVEFRGVNRHEEHPEWGFAFPPKLMKRDIDLMIDMGCNTVRGSHYPNSRIFVDMLDECGLLFWSEIPIWGGGFPAEVLNDPDVVERGLAMHKEMVKYYYNHPSIVFWGMHNEIYAVVPSTYDISKLYSEYLRAHGGNRLITHATIFPMEDKSLEFDDVICINMYHGWYGGTLKDWDKALENFRKKREEMGLTDRPVIFSEFGGGALAGFHSHFDSVRWSEEYQSDLLEYCIELFHRDPMVCGFYVWQFCNTRTSPDMDINRVRTFNNKGILDEYRNPKAAYFTVKKLYHRYAEEGK
ncbi:MAG: beta-glucuronidase [Clostridia bacterium]|nr:beta-glucuronidase [Clostridia bacterium]